MAGYEQTTSMFEASNKVLKGWRDRLPVPSSNDEVTVSGTTTTAAEADERIMLSLSPTAMTKRGG